MKLVRSLLLIAGFVLMSQSAFSADSGISIKAEVDRAFATIGDEINFRVTAIHNPDIAVLNIDPGQALSDFEIKKTTDFSTKEGKQIHEGKNFVITNYQLGEYVVHPITVQYREKAGDVKQIQTNSLYITIESVDKNKKEESDIRGIKGVQKIKFNFGPMIIGLLIVIISGSAFLFFKRSKTHQVGTAPEEILTPHDEAYQNLSRLQNSDLIKKGQIKLYFFQMSEILRRYFERRYKIKALELTTYELKNELKDKTNRDQLQLIDEVLSFCDLAKFAKYVPPPLEIIRENNQAKQIVDETKEVEIIMPPPQTNETK